MATETQKPASRKPEIENPKKTLTLTTPNLLDLNQDSDPHSPADGKVISGDDNHGVTSITTEIAADDIKKKMKRAERFGVPVQISEVEKRNSRAHRFGTVTGPEVSKSSEDLKRKARAERFGISVPADEEEKKKTRVEKFGSDTKINNVEEEKRKARALRFSHPQATAVLHSNGDRDSGSKTEIVDNSSGGA